jgi:hypothetical protein
MSVATRLVEVDLPEDKVLEKLNKVSTAKRQAYMVSELGQMIHGDGVDIMLNRSYTIRSLGRGKTSTGPRQSERGQLDRACVGGCSSADPRIYIDCDATGVERSCCVPAPASRPNTLGNLV